MQAEGHRKAAPEGSNDVDVHHESKMWFSRNGMRSMSATLLTPESTNRLETGLEARRDVGAQVVADDDGCRRSGPPSG